MVATNLRKRFLTTTREKTAVINGDMSSIYQLFTYRNVLYGAKKLIKFYICLWDREAAGSKPVTRAKMGLLQNTPMKKTTSTNPKGLG